MHYVLRTDIFEVYWQRADALPNPELPAHVRIAPLSDEELERLPPVFSVQTDRFHRLGFNRAYGVWLDEVLAHVAWLMTSDVDRLRHSRILKLRDGEAEIAHCFTAPDFRGQGVYGIAIRSLTGIARRQGIHDIYMIVVSGNEASSKGIRSAGLILTARSIRLSLAPNWNGPAFVWRRQRWPIWQK